MKKKKNIIIVLIMIALVGSIFAVMFSNKTWLISTEKKVSESTEVVKIQNKEIEEIKDEFKISEIYEIKGTSKLITGNAWTDMLKSREFQRTLAKKYPDNVFVNGPTNKKQIALTFDDGPDNVRTLKLLDMLSKYDVKVSFFLLGTNIKKYPTVVKRIYDEGHLPLGHTYSHFELTKKSLDTVKKEIYDTENEIEKITGKKPAIIRPPYGDINENLMDEFFKPNNYKLVLWSIDALDWSQRERDNIVNNVVNNARNGDIVLMHTSSTDESIHATETIIKDLKAKEYEFVTLDKMLNISAYKN